MSNSIKSPTHDSFFILHDEILGTCIKKKDSWKFILGNNLYLTQRLFIFHKWAFKYVFLSACIRDQKYERIFLNVDISVLI